MLTPVSLDTPMLDQFASQATVTLLNHLLAREAWARDELAPFAGRGARVEAFQALLRNVRLSGDAEFARALSHVLQNLRPEPEEDLARFVGDAAAVRIVGFLRAVATQMREGSNRLAATAADYFVAENPLLVTREEVESFGNSVAGLRDAAERLGKRIEHLENR